MALSSFGPAPSGVFFTGSATAPSTLVPSQYPVAIHGHPYNIEPKLYRRRHVPIQRPPVDDSGEPGETTLSPEGLWRRSQSDWSLGQGQTWLDEDGSLRRRYRTSLGIDVFTERELTLLPAIEEKRNSANTNLRLLRVGARLYVADGATLIFSNGSGSEQNATWVTGWTTATGLPGSNILDLAYSGSHVYVLGSDNSIYRATPGTTAFTLYYNPTATATRMWSGLGRLFVSDGRSFYEITATPGETLILTHPDANMVWSAFEAAPTGVYIGGNIGTDKGEVRHTWVNDAGTAFVPPVVVAEFPNESVNALRSAGNNILFGTSRGFRYAQIDGQNTSLDFGPVIAVGAVRDFCVDDVNNETFVWFTWDNITSGNSGLGRIRISRFVEPKVPAYASDIYSSSGGSVLCCASLSGRRYFGVSADGFKGATADKLASGSLSTGRIRYGMLDEKVFISMFWRTAPLPAGARVVWEAAYDNDTSSSVGAQDATASVGSIENITLGPETAEWVELTVTLERATVTTTGPTLRWWNLNSIPAVSGVMEFLVPIRLHDKERTPTGPAKQLWVFEERDFLMSLVHSRQIVTYQEGTAAYAVYVVNCEDQPDNWDSMRHNLEGILMVQMHTIT
jgi:hypothetical protein